MCSTSSCTAIQQSRFDHVRTRYFALFNAYFDGTVGSNLLARLAGLRTAGSVLGSFRPRLVTHRTMWYASAHWQTRRPQPERRRRGQTAECEVEGGEKETQSRDVYRAFNVGWRTWRVGF